MQSKVKELIIILVAVLLTACGKKAVSPDTPYVIEGELTGVRDSVEIHLVRWEKGLGESIAKDTIQDGHFSFEGVVEEGVKSLSLSVNDEDFPSMGRTIYVAPGARIKVRGYDTFHATWDIESTLAEQRVHDEISALAKDDKLAMQKVFVEYYQKLGLYHPEMRDREAASQLYKQMLSLDSIIIVKEIRQMGKMKPSPAWIDQLMKFAQHTNSSGVYKAHKKEILALYESIPEEMNQQVDVQEIHAYLYPPQQATLGDKYPDADLYDLDGNVHHISEFQDKYILLDFWSRGCGPCIQSFPKMKELYEEMGDKLTIISISLDPEKHWRIASDKYDITWNNWNELKGRAGLYTNYRINGIPFYVLISPVGTIMEIIRGFNKDYIIEAIEKKL